MRKVYLTRKELAKLLGYSPFTLAKFKSMFPPCIYSKGNTGKALYPVEEIIKWAEENKLKHVVRVLKELQ